VSGPMTVYYSRRATDQRRPPKGSRRRNRILRTFLVLFAVAVLGSLLLIEAYANATFAPDGAGRRPGSSSGVPASVRDGGPVIDATGFWPRSYRPADHTVALTFDDGPDPMWTPRILDVLARHKVQATFFVIGSQVSRYPDLTRRIVAEGHEIGVHTFSHPELDALPTWRRKLEYSQTQMAIAYVAGVKTSLLRPPYSSTSDALDSADWQVVQQVGGQGYLTVLEDTDSRDWVRPGVDAIVRNATPDGSRGAIILMHDAGGDRAQTVAALDRLIPALQERGYEFTTVSTALPSGFAAPVNPAAGSADRWRGRGLVWTIRTADVVMRALWILLLAIGTLTLARTILLFAVALRQTRRRRAPTWSWGPPVTSPISVIVPAYNEEATIAATVRTLAASDYPEIEIVVVDDESTDGTQQAVEDLVLPGVRLVRVPSGGKATALTTGVAMSTNDLVVMVDADTIVEKSSLRELVQPFADPSVGAVAGNVKVGNRRGLLARWQHIEYVIGFSLDRRMYDSLGCMPTVPGALGAFRRQCLAHAGGVSTDTLAEDTDLTMAALRHGWRVVYQDTAKAYTEAPATLRQLWMQRYRWSYGTMQAMWKHRRAVIDDGPSGRFGRFGLPLIALFSIVLPIFGPLLDLLTVYGTLFLDRWITLAGWFAVLMLQAITAILAFRLDREPLRPLWALPLQQFVYRQIMYVVLLQSVVTALTGRRLSWQKLRRSGAVAAGAS
jgi:cellulose synthase/poly-beta-1,6-N-acetylglucosamine synthase-like glycosyltransferase/peptidoglycan/xylan/chitin deacetylase (PgdA/CDA1 family)